MLAVLNWSPKESSYRGIVRGLVSDMGKRAFYNASIVPEVLHLHCNVGESCFRANEKIRAVIFTSGSSLSIGETAFYGCKKLSHVDFGGHVRTIGIEAFYNTIITTKKYIAENIPEKITISATEEYTIDHSLLYRQGSNFLCSNLANLKEFIEAGNTDKIEFLCKYGSSAREYMLNKTYYEYDNLILLAAEKSEKEIDKAERNKYILSAMKHRGFEHYL
jgi:hypothetical protein